MNIELELAFYGQVPQKYLDFMLKTFPQTLEGQWMHCLEYSIKMMGPFPELLLKQGYVYSHENIDNYNPKYPKQYTHAWLETAEGIIVDPSVLQFMNLGKLEYVECVPSGCCMGCGQFFFEKKDTYCGNCEWSEGGSKSITTTGINSCTLLCRFHE